MAYTLLFVADFGPTQTGLTLNAQLYDSDGTPNGSAITTGFVEIDSTNAPGVYSYSHTSVPDDHRGSFAMYKASDQTKRVAFAINPEEAENLDVAVSSRAAGLTGSYDVDLQLYETGTTTPIANVSVSVKNADQSLLLGILTSDSLGQASMARDAGTYKLLCEKAQFTFTTPETLTVTSGSVAQTIYGTPWTAPVAPTVYTCYVYGWVKDVDNTALSGKTVSAKIANKPVYYSGVGYTSIQSASDTTDSDGYFELLLTRSKYMTTITGASGKYTLTIAEVGLVWTIEVPNTSSAEFDDCRV